MSDDHPLDAAIRVGDHPDRQVATLQSLEDAPSLRVRLVPEGVLPVILSDPPKGPLRCRSPLHLQALTDEPDVGPKDLRRFSRIAPGQDRIESPPGLLFGVAASILLDIESLCG